MKTLTEAELERVISETTAVINDAYWIFTRTARGLPPCGDPSEWPEDLRMREWPRGAA